MEGNFSLAWAILGLPLVGFLVQALFGGAVVKALGAKTGKRIMGFLAVLPIAIAFGIGILLTQALTQLPADAKAAVVPGFDWIRILGLTIPFELRVDALSMTMTLIITGIGALIHLYATAYMADDNDFTRFFTYMNLFVAAMLILVLGNNLVMLFIGWEGVGLCSYLLIGFWYKDVANAKAANKAFIVNRIGDWGLTLGMFMIFVTVAANTDYATAGNRWLSYDVALPVLLEVLRNNAPLATAIGLLLFVGAAGKSAQFPLYLWLPDAMAGPTPVSALIHAATMVTSGVVLLNRFHVVFEASPVASAIICAIGAFTALFAALVAFGQTDIKKVLAYSTVSQLGFMFVACGAGAYWAGMFHVTTHAFFKALLFLGSGAVIYAMAHDQDMRNYGNLRKYLPITCWTMFAGFLAIAGVSFYNYFGFAGFYSKEAVIGSALAGHHGVIGSVNVQVISGWVALFVAFLTAMYMTRMTWLTFFGKEERWRAVPAHADDHGHEEVHGHDHTHAHHEDHGPDLHKFFYTDAEMEARHAGDHDDHHHHALDANHTPKEVPAAMWFPLVVLAILSVIGGYWLYKLQPIEYWLFPGGKLPILGEVHYHPEGFDLVLLSGIAAFGGILAGWLVYRNGLPKREGWDMSKWSPFRRAAAEQFGYDNAMMSAAVEGGEELGKIAWKGIDVGLIDGIVNGIGKFFGGLALGFRTLQTGALRFYALVMLVGAVAVLGWMIYAMQGLVR